MVSKLIPLLLSFVSIGTVWAERFPLAPLDCRQGNFDNPAISSCALASSVLRKAVLARRSRLNCRSCPGDRHRRGIGSPAGCQPDPCCASVAPSDEEAQDVVRALDELFRAFTMGHRRAFFSRVDRHYELGITELEQSFRRAHRKYRDFQLRYHILNIRKRDAVIDVSIDWNMGYAVAATGGGVSMRGTTQLALNRCDHFRLLSQKGTLLFCTF